MFFPPCFRADAEITIWGPSSPEASLESRIARYISAPLSPVEVRELPCSVSFQDAPATRMGDRRSDDPRRGGHPPRADPRLPDHRRRYDDRLHPRPRAGARIAAGRPRAGMDLGLRPRPRRRPADPRLPVHRRRVPGPRRLGALGHVGHAHVRRTGRGEAPDALPPRPAAHRRDARRPLGPPRASAGPGSAADATRSSWPSRAPRSRSGGDWTACPSLAQRLISTAGTSGSAGELSTRG